MKNFAEVAHPLFQSTQKYLQFEWNSEAEQAFILLKQALTEALVLGYPNPDGYFILDTDASNYGVGAVLSQVQGRQERVVAYYSCALTQPERQYCVTRKELLAIVKAQPSISTLTSMANYSPSGQTMLPFVGY